MSGETHQNNMRHLCLCLLFAARAGGEIFGNGTVVERNDTTAELNASSDAELWKVEL